MKQEMWWFILWVVILGFIMFKAIGELHREGYLNPLFQWMQSISWRYDRWRESNPGSITKPSNVVKKCTVCGQFYSDKTAGRHAHQGPTQEGNDAT